LFEEVRACGQLDFTALNTFKPFYYLRSAFLALLKYEVSE
tara:strand:- start:693 stop:812 length:120 start_codon:yes stop_codon:yes gene_type:complete